MNGSFPNIFNVKDYGASGNKGENAKAAIQQAIDACANAGGGMVYLPPGEYTTGTLHLRSNVRIYVEAGAKVFSSKDPADFDKRGLFYAEDVKNITLQGRGTIDGQAEYTHRITDMQDWYIYPNQLQAEQAGWPLVRAFPTPDSVGHLVLFVRCQNVRIEDLTFLHSPSWTMHLWGIDGLKIDGVSIFTSLQDGVWADGIDPDGCKNVHISNCTIETGDDALVFYSSNAYGPARPCENITVTNCKLTSSSSALKFCDGNLNAIRNVTINNCVIKGANRGIAFMVFDGGVLEDVVLSNLIVECERYDWFWWGDGDPIHFNLIQRSEIDQNIDKAKEPAPGIIRNVIFRDILAKGQGSCLIHGHVDSPLENIFMENIRLSLAFNPHASPRNFENAVKLENARNFQIRNLEVVWDEPFSQNWHSALVVENVENLTIEGFKASNAPGGEGHPVVILKDVRGGKLKNPDISAKSCPAVQIEGSSTQRLHLHDGENGFSNGAVSIATEVDRLAVHITSQK